MASGPTDTPGAPRSSGVALAGFMGAGKSTVGRALAAALGLPFVDLDDVVEAAAGRSIPEIFSREGEAGFRAWETEVLAALCAGPPVVLALGGGTLHEPGNLDRVRGAMPVFVLDVPLARVLARLGEGEGRPLAGQAAALYARRRAGYRAAGTVVDGDRPVAAVVADIRARLEAA